MSDALAVQEIADLAQAAVDAEVGVYPFEGVEDLYRIVTPDGVTSEIHNMEKYHDEPATKRGTVKLHEAPSFVSYVKAHRLPYRTALYANIDQQNITALINGHHEAYPEVPATVDKPGSTLHVSHEAGWGDHRAVLGLRFSDNWKHWVGKDRKWLGQEEFAEHVEEYLLDIVAPTPANVLEMAQSLHGTNSVKFKSQSLLRNGQRQFAYEETIETKAGQRGDLEVPTELALALPIFDGAAEALKVNARIQFRLNSGNLLLRYLLDQPNAIVRAAFEAVVADIESTAGMLAYRGEAPAALR